MPISAFPKLKNRRPSKNSVSDVTLRDFSGGLKVTENEINLKSKYATKLINMFAGEDNSQEIRYGTKLFARQDFPIINIEYFKQHIVSVQENGDVYKIDNNKIVEPIFNDTIAATRPGNPTGWTSATEFVDFTEFRGNLIVCNGKDKPLIIDRNLEANYLQDIPTGSNINVPIGKFCTTVSNYVVIAGVPAEPETIFISATGASGTWPGDPEPNDATSFNVGAFASEASSEITAIESFKNFLIIYFDNLSILIELGKYNAEGVHEPDVVDTYPTLGTVNNKTIIKTPKDVLFISNLGIYSANRNIFGGTLETKSTSENLGKDYPAILSKIGIGDSTSFAVNDPLSKTLFFFINGDAPDTCYAMRYTDDFRKKSWSKIEGMNFTSGCTSERGRVFLALGNSIWQYGNSVFDDEEYYVDYITEDFEGYEINFEWELPWLDAGNRIKTKKLEKITFDTSGIAKFTLQCFVNKFLKNKETGEDDPAAEMEFIGGDAGGYGNNVDGYGGGNFSGHRRANDERFYGFPIKFKILKLRIKGSTRNFLKISSMSLIYTRGNYNP